MGDRKWGDGKVHGEGLIVLPAVLVGAGVGLAPIVNPKTNALAYGSHWIESITWNSTGRITIVNRDRFMGLVGWDPPGYQDINYATTRSRKTMVLVTQNMTNQVVGGVPARTSTWAIENWADAGTNTLADLLAGQFLYLSLTVKNSAVYP